MRVKVDVNGKRFSASKNNDIFVLWLGAGKTLELPECKTVTYDGEDYFVTQVCDPFAPPFHDEGHKNVGLFVELTVSKIKPVSVKDENTDSDVVDHKPQEVEKKPRRSGLFLGRSQ